MRHLARRAAYRHGDVGFDGCPEEYQPYFLTMTSCLLFWMIMYVLSLFLWSIVCSFILQKVTVKSTSNLMGNHGLLNIIEVVKDCNQSWSWTKCIFALMTVRSARQGVECNYLNENVPLHRLWYLSTWPSVGGVVWGGLGNAVLLEEVHHWRQL